jgi:hypothetical protein
MVPIICDKVNIHQVLDTQQRFRERNPMAGQRVYKSQHKYWINYAPECFDLVTSPWCHLATILAIYNEARLRRHHRPEPTEFVIPGILFMEGHHHEMIKYTEIDGMKIIRYHN